MEKDSRLGVLLVASVSVFILFEVVGGIVFGLMQNYHCFKYLGCNAGFFGYDAFIHFLAGMMELVFILWLAKKSPKFNFFHEDIRKNIIILISLVALVAVSWEIWEFSGDRLRIVLSHQDLLHPNRLFQPSNSDTMGDLCFTLFGAATMITILGFYDKKYLVSK